MVVVSDANKSVNKTGNSNDGSDDSILFLKIAMEAVFKGIERSLSYQAGEKKGQYNFV